MTPAVNRTDGFYQDADGFVHPITEWYDLNALECAPDDAVAAVAGSEGRWFALDLREFETCRSH